MLYMSKEKDKRLLNATKNSPFDKLGYEELAHGYEESSELFGELHHTIYQVLNKLREAETLFSHSIVVSGGVRLSPVSPSASVDTIPVVKFLFLAIISPHLY